MKKRAGQSVLSICTLGFFSLSGCYANASEQALPEYTKQAGISGNLSSVGSDTLANIMTFWAEDFRYFYPNVNIQIQAAGSSTAPIALIEGTSNFGPMSRKMKAKEKQAFEYKYGYQPTAIPVAVDAMAVFVHKDNPIEGLNIAQVDAIFSENRKCGANKSFTHWGELGLTGNWQYKDFQLYGRNSASGTYGYFKTKALCKGDFKSDVNEQPGSASVVQSITESLNGIGYSGIGYKTSGVRILPLAKTGNRYIEANAANTVAGKYPLSRFLYLYINKHPNKPLIPMEAEFIKMILSRSGQKVVKKDGYIALPASTVHQVLTQLNL